MSPVLTATLAVFTVVAVGAILRHTRLLSPQADTSLLKLVVWVLMPCIIFDNILDSDALQTTTNLWLPPLIGFGTTALGIALAGLAAWAIGPHLGLRSPQARRTFAVAVGLHNYGYLPIPLAQALHDDPTARADVLGVLFINNIGVDLAMWTLGVMVISGTVGWAGLRRAVNPPVCAVVLAMLLRSAGGRAWIPSFADHALGMLAHCAVPVALVMIGATMYDVWSANDSTSHNNTPNTPAPPRRATWALALSACVLRLGLLPLTFVAVTIALPWFFTGPSTQAAPLRSVLILHAAMPSAIFPIMLARHYDGDPAVATHVALATSAASLITMPLWISWLGQ